MWAYVNGGNAHTGSGFTTVAVTTGWTVTAGDLLIATLSQFGGSLSGVSISDTHNTYTLQASKANGNPTVFVWTAPVTTGGTLTITVTTTSPAFLTLMIDEFSCSGTIGAVESIVTGTGTSTSPAPGTITPTATDLLIAVFASSNGGGVAATISSPFTVSASQVNGSPNISDGALGYALDQTSAQSPVFTKSGTPAWSAAGFGVKGTASTTKVVPYWHLFQGLNTGAMDTP